jgi:hypothetical protein
MAAGGRTDRILLVGIATRVAQVPPNPASAAADAPEVRHREEHALEQFVGNLNRESHEPE